MNRRRMIAAMGGGGEWLHTIYVATTGNDTTGNGSKAAPYLTIGKALSVAVAGDGILLATGTYVGDNLLLSRFSDFVDIQSESRVATDVVLSGRLYITSGGGARYMRWRYMTLSNSGADTLLMGKCDHIIFDNMIISNTGAPGNAVRFVNATDTTLQNSTVSNTGGASAILVGMDGDTGGDPNTVLLKNLLVDAGTSHGITFGHGCINCVADGLTITGSADYGLIAKHCAGVEFKNCDIASGTSAALYFKGATTPNAHHNILRAAAGYGFKMARSDDTTKCSDWILQYNQFIISGSGKSLTIGNDLHDEGGGVCDYNIYKNNSGLGIVRNDADVANLAELQAAWEDYDVTTNDAHSTVV